MLLKKNNHNVWHSYFSTTLKPWNTYFSIEMWIVLFFSFTCRVYVLKFWYIWSISNVDETFVVRLNLLPCRPKSIGRGMMSDTKIHILTQLGWLNGIMGCAFLWYSFWDCVDQNAQEQWKALTFVTKVHLLLLLYICIMHAILAMSCCIAKYINNEVLVINIEVNFSISIKF